MLTRVNERDPACAKSRRHSKRTMLWRRQTLARQFFIAGSAFSLAAMALVGVFVTQLIEQTVTRNAASSTALYVDSTIAPLLPDMARGEILDETSSRVLDEILAQGPLGERLKTFRLWARDGRILYSSDRSQIGQRYSTSANLKQAFEGELVAEFGDLDDIESAA